jgi:NAD(P)-dependent dehydrogenase (short-subunit alcohol dehydrogenase family)
MTAPVAIITGASQGIGAGLVGGYRRAGHAVVGVSLSHASSDDDDFIAVAEEGPLHAQR